MNGTRTEEEMRRRSEKYRRAPVDLNFQIGCIVLCVLEKEPVMEEFRTWHYSQGSALEPLGTLGGPCYDALCSGALSRIVKSC
jgi:hypothetical protein